MNRTPERIESWVEAVLVENISGAPGRETWQMVELRVSENGYEAVPVHGESGLITMLATAYGTVRIPRYTDGMDAGTLVKVFPV